MVMSGKQLAMLWNRRIVLSLSALLCVVAGVVATEALDDSQPNSTPTQAKAKPKAKAKAPARTSSGERPAPAAPLPVAGKSRKDRPNLVLIISDDQAFTDFGFMGHELVKTPAIDALAAKSATFLNGYVPTSLCRASLATLLTGQYAHQHCICFNDPPKGVERDEAHPLIARSPALPRILTTVGYRSFQTGKFWEGHYANAGFTDGMTVKGRHGDTGLAIGRETMAPIGEFLDKTNGSPFFLWYAPMLPHTPHNPPQKYLDEYQNKGLDAKTAAYYATIRWFDDSVAALMKMLEERNMTENTAIMFLVDNGWAVPLAGERMGYAVRSKNSPFDRGLRTPVMVYWPGHTKAGRHEDLVSSIDVVPTLLDMAGVGYAKTGLPGMSLLDVAEGRKPGLDRKAVYGELYLHTASKLGDPIIDMTYKWVRKGDWKLIMPTELASETAKKPVGGDPLNLVINPTSGPFLYNVKEDPSEQKNLAMDPAQADRIKELASELDQWLETR